MGKKFEFCVKLLFKFEHVLYYSCHIPLFHQSMRFNEVVSFGGQEKDDETRGFLSFGKI